jgi:gamma-glutamylputrescine oxidase
MSLDLLTVNDTPERYPPSWFAATAIPFAPCSPLRGEASADVCVIGGGYTGLSAALHLAEAGFDVVLLEAHRVGWGASGRNGGQVGSGQRQGQGWMERHLGRERALALWAMGQEAKALVRALVSRHTVDCALKPGIIHAAHKQGSVPELHDEAEKLAKDYGYDEIDCLDRTGIRERVGTEAYFGGVIDRGGGHLHPLNFALGLARAAAEAGVRIHEESRVAAIEPGPVSLFRTGQGTVRARHVVLAANGYHGGLLPDVSARVMPINNFIVATEPLGRDRARALIRDDAAVADTRFVVNYFRLSEDRRLLFGGGESYGYRFPRDIAGLVRPAMLKVFPELAGVRIDHAWGGTLAITLNRLPSFARPAPGIFSAAGYSGHGVALATLAGKLLAEAVSGTASRFDVFADLPQPRFPGGGALRAPLLALAMTWYALRDRL